MPENPDAIWRQPLVLAHTADASWQKFVTGVDGRSSPAPLFEVMRLSDFKSDALFRIPNLKLAMATCDEQATFLSALFQWHSGVKADRDLWLAFRAGVKTGYYLELRKEAIKGIQGPILRPLYAGVTGNRDII